MEHHNILGIYLSKNTATAVVISTHSQSVLDCFTVTTDPEQESQPGSLAPLIARELAGKQYEIDDVYVALDCSFFTQHEIHSEFTDAKQIAGTIRFDTEDALATDATKLAIAYLIKNTTQQGSDITAFTAETQLLTEILTDFQAVALDPAAIEPDIISLARFLNTNAPKTEEQNSMFVTLSTNACYMITSAAENNIPLGRSFLLGAGQNRTEVLTRQIPLTVASLSAQSPVTNIRLAGQIQDVDLEALGQKSPYPVECIDLYKLSNADEQFTETCPCEGHFAAACGAALGEISKTKKVDFREDFMPYQGKRRIIQKAMRILSVSLTVVILTLGVYLQFKVFQNKGYIKDLHEKTVKDYRDGMYGSKPPASMPIVTKLNHELQRVEKIQKGLGPADENSITAKLTFILEAINKLPANTDIQVSDITVTQTTMRVTGDTNSRAATLQLFDVFSKHEKLKKTNESLSQKGGRDTFSVNLELK